MKKLLPVFVLCFLVASKITAQVNIYHAFPDSNAFWQYKHTNSLNPNIHDQHRLGIKGDTIINSFTYHKIYSLFDSTLNSPWSTYYGAGREQNKQVFGMVGGNQESILYDFNMLVGDTITYTYSIPMSSNVVFKSELISIDSMLMHDGNYRKRFIYHPIPPGNSMPNDTVVEGLGSICWQGLFDPLINAFCTCGDAWQVTCIKTADTTRFLRNPDCDHCFCTFLTGINEAQNFSGKISPNPFNEKTTISFSRSLNNAALTVFDATGRQVRSIKNIIGQTISVSRNEMPAGVYLIELKEGSAILANEKIIVAD